MTARPVCVSFHDLKEGTVDLLTLNQALGPDSLGVILVKDLPSDFTSLRKRVLSYSSHLANLDSEELTDLEAPEANYLVGWSCGKERLGDNQTVDTLKGSFYANCSFHVEGPTTCTEEFHDLPEFTAPNIWPGKSLPQFECNLMINVAQLVARACDKFAVHHIIDYENGYLERVIRTSTTTKARLLHYFPSPAAFKDSDEDLNEWCSLHADTSALTALTSAMFVDEIESLSESQSSGRIDLEELDCSPDPDAGLYIRDRMGGLIKVSIPRDCLAFQTGEALEAVTEQKFKAVPHLVKGCRASMGPNIARNTLAVFCQPSLQEPIGDENFATFAKRILQRNLHMDVPHPVS